ncbi:hypothetical protein QWZ08_10080 [Ferruginibacter paludis]|uniref:hypothetical protein n=1 Tax=Ferruginibacter paludis TaxID=1310417 RepID=UPI0025B36877|nr:hypothetical protein [Ferruginibacter paludis]MDN3655974.1 hypothetical protein [Ferruginibacter paludis]
MYQKLTHHLKEIVLLLLISACLLVTTMYAQTNLATDYFKISINSKGFITSMKNSTVQPNREFGIPGKPSPLLCLYNSRKKIYYEPQKASFSRGNTMLFLKYINGSVAKLKIETKAKYFTFTLLSLSNRSGIDDVQWGSYYTNITNLFGEVIGVARDTSDAGNYAIGVLSLNDQTTGGKSTNVGDCAPFQYVIHSPDKKRFSLPANLHEGQVFSIGGDGISDVAFYSHPEPYYRILYGNSAEVNEQGQISIAYHAADRTKGKTILFSLIPQLPTNAPNHIEAEPLPGVDFIGSSIALWGCADSIALLSVIKSIVQSEGLPWLTVNGKWIKDPAAYVPDVASYGNNYDSIISYTQQLGFKAIQLEDLPMFGADRNNNGYIDGTTFQNKPLVFTSGNQSHKEFTDSSNRIGIWAGRHTIMTSLRRGTKDVSPIPSDNLCYQFKKVLANKLSSSDTVIEVANPAYLEETGSWEGHEKSLNILKIGKELIYYAGVTKTNPYTLQHVTRGYWGTTPAKHQQGDTIYKLQVTIGYGYDGLIPGMQLQDSIAAYYADMSNINGLYFHDWDGQEFLFNQGHGYYSVKRFHRKLFEKAAAYHLPDLRITGATLSEGSWHYQSVWNVGGGTNMYDLVSRKWGSTTSEGKDLRDVAYANYFPASFGINFGLDSLSTVANYNHIEAIAIGSGATYQIPLSKLSVEACTSKYAIFSTIKIWEQARAANAFSRTVKKQLADPARNWQLEQVDNNHWKLYPITDDTRSSFMLLTRDTAGGY